MALGSYPQNTVAAEISKYMGNAVQLSSIWGSIIYNVKASPYLAKGDGTTNDTASIQAAVTDAAVNGGIVFFPPGTYTTGNQTIPINVTMEFANGSKLSINSGAIVTINGFIQAGAYSIFSGSGTVTYAALNEQVFPEWWGAKGDGVTNDSAAIQSAINASRTIQFRAVTYYIGTQINIPQNKFVELLSAGYRQTKFLISPNIVGFKYLRDSTVGGSVVTFEGIEFTESGLGKTSKAVYFYGTYSGSQGAETAKYDDNWLRMYDCSFYGFYHGVEMSYCGQCYFVRCYGQANTTVYFLNRDASFVNWLSCMNLNNDTFIYADDTIADAVSNGLNIQNCQSVFSNKADVRILGWQSVYIHGGGGFDLGGTGDTNSVYLGKCMDINIDGMWISANHSTNRNCIFLDDCHSVAITNNSIVNAGAAGIRVSRSVAKNCAVTITGNKMDGNTQNDILLASNVIGAVVMGNKILSSPSRTGTNYEIYANTGGTDYCIIKNNTMKGVSYTISSGTNSIVNENLFGLPYIG
jgi:hypothetical protein